MAACPKIGWCHQLRQAGKRARAVCKRVAPVDDLPVVRGQLVRDTGEARTRHIAAMCDGNRRWAREAGFIDVSHGHRVAVKKISELVHGPVNAGLNLYHLFAEHREFPPR